MSNKRFDFSVLPDWFFMETNRKNISRHKQIWVPTRMCDYYRLINFEGVRPMICEYIFNDGSMVLPDGLVVLNKYRDGKSSKTSTTILNTDKKHFRFPQKPPSQSIAPTDFDLQEFMNDTIAVKIIGAHPDYAEHAKELGMEVVEI